jgi:UDP-glucuronate 4-epimerase
MAQRRIFVTGTAGFIGYHLAELLLREGHQVAGYDGLTDYYGVSLKQQRHAMLNQHDGFSATEAMLEDEPRLSGAIKAFNPDVIVHLAAQAGVRYSIDNPRAYLDANITGTFNVMEAARTAGVEHLLMASTSSVYGANTHMPFTETERVATPLTFYAASKLANEAMGHGDGPTWPISNSRETSSRANQSTFTIMARCGVILPMSMTWCAASPA